MCLATVPRQVCIPGGNPGKPGKGIDCDCWGCWVWGWVVAAGAV